MNAKAVTVTEREIGRLDLRVAWLCGLVLLLEGYDIAAVGYAIPSIADTWRLAPSAFTPALTAGNVGLLLGSIGMGLLGDRLGRKPMLISCVVVFGAFSLFSALVDSPFQLATLRFLTGLGLGGGIPLAVALASDFARPMMQGRLVILMSAGVPIGFTLGGLLASRLVQLLGWPAIFMMGGVLPFAIIPVLALWLPESVITRASTSRGNPVIALFADRLAPCTVLLWAMNFFNLFANFVILLWTPAILHSTGVSASRSIFGTSMYGVGTILGALLTAPVTDRLGVERVLTYTIAFGALCVLAIGLVDMEFWLLSIVICGAGMGIGSCQTGLNSLSGRIYPPAIRSTGAGWALGLGRTGAIAGPLIGGALLTLGFRGREIFLAAFIPVIIVAVLMAILGRLRR
jgi:AAHS family 4-hydroxybenzoate transporter-like MFS transporter